MLKDEVLKILLSSGSHVSGQDISTKLGVSRTAVWKAVTALKNDGYDIESVNNKGYLLTKNKSILNEAEIETCMHLYDCKVFPKILYFNSIDSTNTYAKKTADLIPSDFLVVADTQTLGRGRLGRSWSSPSSTGIYMSLCIRPNISLEKASMITLIMATAICDAIEELYHISPLIKWPNDIVINSKKICGILTEMSCDMDGIKYIISGVGINVYDTAFPDDIKDTASSLLLETGTKADRAKIISSAIYHFYEDLDTFMQTEDMSVLKSKYESRLANIGREVMILDPKGEYPAIALGIDETGALLVNANGKIKRIISGEVSVRGIYGYT